MSGHKIAKKLCIGLTVVTVASPVFANTGKKNSLGSTTTNNTNVEIMPGTTFQFGVYNNSDDRTIDDIFENSYKMGAQEEDDRSTEELLAPALEKQEREEEEERRRKAIEEAQQMKFDSTNANLDLAVLDYYLDTSNLVLEQGWYEDPVSGNWYYVLSNGTLATDYMLYYQGDTFYFDERGKRIDNDVVDYKGEKYFFNEYGVMEKNVWIVKTTNDDGAYDLKRYYFGPNGRAYRASGSRNFVIKEISGEKYAFNSEAEMLYGYIDKNGNILDEEDEYAYENCEYYFGTKDEPEMQTGWVLYTGKKDTDRYEDKNELYLYFSPETGKKFKASTDDNGDEKAKGRYAVIEGASYRFDEYGVMRSGWLDKEQDASTTTDLNKKYFSYDYEGWLTEGWFSAVPPKNSVLKRNQDYNSTDEEKWFYSDTKGRVLKNQIKRIGDNYFCFDIDGVMREEVFVVVDSSGQPKSREGLDEDDDYPIFSVADITKKMFFEPSSDEDDLLHLQEGDKVMYFTSSLGEEDKTVDGSMVYGKNPTEITIKDDDVYFRAKANGGISSYDPQSAILYTDGKLYQNGLLLRADNGNKFGICRGEDGEYKVVNTSGKAITGTTCKKVVDTYIFIYNGVFKGLFNCEVKVDSNKYVMYREKGEKTYTWKYFLLDDGITRIKIEDFNKDTVNNDNYSKVLSRDKDLYINFTTYTGDAPSYYSN